MTKIVVLPNEKLCPEGVVIEAWPGESICRALLRNHIEIEHACELSCACTTCHVIVREGYDSLQAPDELEDDYLDKGSGRMLMIAPLSCWRPTLKWTRSQ